MQSQSRYPAPLITLLSDFGLQDEYVAVLKGVILGICPSARIVDISHLVPPQDVAGASLLLSRAVPFFPEGTVHLAIVDPQVGSDRAILVIAAQGHLFVGPDNGLFSFLFEKDANFRIFRVDLALLDGPPASATFHGRDIMAPLAAKLAGGADPASLGTEISADLCHKLARSRPRRVGSTLHGEITRVDTFGNLCSNLQQSDFTHGVPLAALTVILGDGRVVPLVKTYAEAGQRPVVALFDSSGFLEIACNLGNAAQQLALGRGAPLIVVENLSGTAEEIDTQRKI